MDEAQRAAEWNRLYQGVRRRLCEKGTESAFGDGDFWVVDDDWGDYLQKVYVFKMVIAHPSASV